MLHFIQITYPISISLHSSFAIPIICQGFPGHRPSAKREGNFFYALTPPPQPCATLTFGATRATLTIGGGN
jgi:hypothetical protein